MFAIKSYLRVIVVLFFAFPAAATEMVTELVIVEQTGCEWCERWDEEIGVIYDKTTEGKFAPLRRVDIFTMPPDLELSRRVNFTPTFLVVVDGQELGRLEGYPGEDFFWPLLGRLLKEHTDYDPSAGAGG